LGKLVGLSLILVGLLGLKEIEEEKDEKTSIRGNRGMPVIRKSSTIFMSGLLQGFTGIDSLIALIPSLSVASLSSILIYATLLAIGCSIVMSLFCALLGQFDKALLRHDPSGGLPLLLSSYACYSSVVIGIVMTILDFSGLTG